MFSVLRFPFSVLRLPKRSSRLRAEIEIMLAGTVKDLEIGGTAPADQVVGKTVLEEMADLLAVVTVTEGTRADVEQPGAILVWVVAVLVDDVGLTTVGVELGATILVFQPGVAGEEVHPHIDGADANLRRGTAVTVPIVGGDDTDQLLGEVEQIGRAHV